jgi:hypothetical protein
MADYPSRIFLCCALLVATLSCSTATASTYQVTSDGVYLNGMRVPTRLKVLSESRDSEVRDHISIEENDSKCVVLMKILSSSGQMEVWVAKSSENSTPTLAFSAPVDMTVRWLDDDYFIIERHSMGASVSYIFMYDKSRSQAIEERRVDNLLIVDMNCRLVASLRYVRGAPKIVFSQLEDDQEMSIDVNLLVSTRSMALESIKNISIQNCSLTFVATDPTGRAGAETRVIPVPTQLCN